MVAGLPNRVGAPPYDRADRGMPGDCGARDTCRGAQLFVLVAGQGVYLGIRLSAPARNDYDPQGSKGVPLSSLPTASYTGNFVAAAEAHGHIKCKEMN